MLQTSHIIANWTNEQLVQAIKIRAKHTWFASDEFTLLMLRLIAQRDLSSKSRVSLAVKLSEDCDLLGLTFHPETLYEWMSDFSDEELGISN